MSKVAKMDRHHRKPTSIGGANNDPRNISVIKTKKHEAWHMLFNNMQAEEIAREINDKYLDADYVMLPIFVGTMAKEDVLKIIRKLTKSLDY